MLNKLIEIDRNDLPRLRDLYACDWPKYQVSFYTIDNYRRWYEQTDRIDDVGIYALNGDWSDGLYFVIDGPDVYFNTLSNDLTRLANGLSCLDPSETYCPSEYDMRFEPIVLEFVKHRNLNWKPDKSTLFHLSKEDALKFSDDQLEGITFRELSPKNAEEINDVWPHRFPGSVEFMKRLIRFNPSVGAYNDQGELLAWCMNAPIGCLGVLQVKEGHQRKGLGFAVVKYMSKKVAERGDDILASILVGNTPSVKMFSKLGFAGGEELGWLYSNDHVH